MRALRLGGGEKKEKSDSRGWGRCAEATKRNKERRREEGRGRGEVFAFTTAVRSR